MHPLGVIGQKGLNPMRSTSIAPDVIPIQLIKKSAMWYYVKHLRKICYDEIGLKAFIII